MRRLLLGYRVHRDAFADHCNMNENVEDAGLTQSFIFTRPRIDLITSYTTLITYPIVGGFCKADR